MLTFFQSGSPKSSQMSSSSRSMSTSFQISPRPTRSPPCQPSSSSRTDSQSALRMPHLLRTAVLSVPTRESWRRSLRSSLARRLRCWGQDGDTVRGRGWESQLATESAGKLTLYNLINEPAKCKYFYRSHWIIHANWKSGHFSSHSTSVQSLWRELSRRTNRRDQWQQSLWY